MAGSVSSLSSTFLLPPSPPVPLFAVFDTVTQVLLVTFNKLLVSQPTRKINWTVWDGLNRWLTPAGFGASFLHDTTVQIAASAPDFQAPRLRYTATFPDVVGRNGLAVEAFDHFPVVII